MSGRLAFARLLQCEKETRQMRIRLFASLIAVAAMAFAVNTARADYARAGWTATLVTHVHGVSGFVEIVDANTIHVYHFNYDGGGSSVFFTLGATNSYFGYHDGVQVGPQLISSAPYVDVDFGDINVPDGLDGYVGVSVWCVVANASFGDGSFVPAGDINGDGVVNLADLNDVKNHFGEDGSAGGDANHDGAVNLADLNDVKNHFGDGAAPAGFSTVPEPAALTLLVLGGLPLALRRRRRNEC
jgi:Electron transfer DM13/Dockerin type I domain